MLRYPPNRPSATQPPPVYGELRDVCPVAPVRLPSGDDGYLVSRYEDVRDVLCDPVFSRAATVHEGAPRLTAQPFEAGGLFTLDPPEHTRLRALVAGEFTPRRVRELRPRIEHAAQRLVDELVSHGPGADLVRGYAFPLPAAVICELLGVPYEERERFRGWSEALLSLTAHSPGQMRAARDQLLAFLGELVGSKRKEPGDDLLSALVLARDEQGALSHRELLTMAMTLLVAGHETTASVIGTSALTLLRSPGGLATLESHPAGRAAVVEELLRYNPIGDGGPLRVTLAETEIAGTRLPANSAVIASICSAGRDETVFARPDAFDPGRPEVRSHLAFGHGVHYCLGASLARAELAIALGALAARLPGLRLAVGPEEIRMHSGLLVNQLVELPVTW
ncbi:cytochrome P450 [Streptomyces sp. RB6PN25]|uniref:Cytochrome P450 n=1 Tax=Streptomyces humicola TaxID=2953240 RepID=A0ABT1Q315_9ACTN|nr:cytochrome P450 [Streptomyces humicola]MCQ4084279.1 cytochrome P450 [Streptomyces humicola]